MNQSTIDKLTAKYKPHSPPLCYRCLGKRHKVGESALATTYRCHNEAHPVHFEYTKPDRDVMKLIEELESKQQLPLLR